MYTVVNSRTETLLVFCNPRPARNSASFITGALTRRVKQSRWPRGDDDDMTNYVKCYKDLFSIIVKSAVAYQMGIGGRIIAPKNIATGWSC